ncbi:MAG: hypothetical protein ACREFQ_15515 [Stellaceae bacterium]
MTRPGGLILIAILVAAAVPALAQSSMTKVPAGEMHMPMGMADKPAGFAPTKQAYTGNHQFLVKLLSVPTPIPFEKYFDLRFSVYDGKDPAKQLSDARLQVFAGMRHGLKQGFAHGMQSSPKVATKNGVFTVSGMFFHMTGSWTLRTTVKERGVTGIAYFQLPCCGQ